MVILMLIGCADKNNESDALFLDDVSPVLTEGQIWCNAGVDESSPAYLFFLEVYADDPQGELDLYTEATWTGSVIENGQIMVEDNLYWENSKYVYSFHHGQHPSIKCDELERFKFTAQTTDWSGNESNTIELENLGFVEANPN